MVITLFEMKKSIFLSVTVPLEFLTLWLDMPFMLLLSDIRQRIIHPTIFKFFVCFCLRAHDCKFFANRIIIKSICNFHVIEITLEQCV